MPVFLCLACLSVNGDVGKWDVLLHKQREDGIVTVYSADRVENRMLMLLGGWDGIGELLLAALESGALLIVWIRLVHVLSIVAVVRLLYHP